MKSLFLIALTYINLVKLINLRYREETPGTATLSFLLKPGTSTKTPGHPNNSLNNPWNPVHDPQTSPRAPGSPWI